MVLKRLIDHAYGSTSVLDDNTCGVLNLMKQRLMNAGPKTVVAQAAGEWIAFTDAAFHKDSKTGGLGATLVNSEGSCVA